MRLGAHILGVALAVACFSAAPAAASTAAAGWRVVWEDDFAGDTLDRAFWAVEESCWGGGNDERQCYTDRPENVVVDGGYLRLKARPEKFSGPAKPESPRGETRERAYTSGKVTTRGKRDWRYGRISARMKLPKGQGAWPAFWMMPAAEAYGAWPLSGEIDIMEAVNLETACDECDDGVERRTSGALHFGGLWPRNTYRFAYAEDIDNLDPANEWHVYSIEWAEGVIQWFVDDQIFMRMTSDDWGTEAKNAEDRPYAPFDQSFFINLNLAVGGNLAERKNGRGFDPETFPAELLVDWVRVEQCAGDETTARACLSDVRWSGELGGPWENDPS